MFYGDIIGCFLCYFIGRIFSAKQFFAAIVPVIFVVVSWQIELTPLLWLNFIGCAFNGGIRMADTVDFAHFE
jgi:hypothetical protein